MKQTLLNEMIPRKQLKDLGFYEAKENLFIKHLAEGISLYRDYRNEEPVSYAYKGKNPIKHTLFKEFTAIIEIEKELKKTLIPYTIPNL